jgi:hypothetical protein
MTMRLFSVFLLALSVSSVFSPAQRTERVIEDAAGLREALKELRDGTTLKLGPGEYGGGYAVSQVRDLHITALDPEQKPRFTGGNQAWHFSRCEGLQVSHLRISGQKHNGLNIDDGGDRLRPVKGITLRHLEVSDIGPKGNFDGIKCSGLMEVVIEDCRIHGWGGQGIDFVGCHQAGIRRCHLQGKEGFSGTAGIQLKGGSSGVIVEDCTFLDATARPLNIGGSTGLEFIRPPEAKAEAARITVRRNRIEGGECAAAFVGVDGCEFSQNHIILPRKWIFRILQETRAPGFVPCRKVSILDNRIEFERARVRTEINIGDATAADTFVFRGNHWTARDQPEASRPQLPVQESGGRYGP